MKRTSAFAVFMLGFLPAFTVGAYTYSGKGAPWSDNPYIIDVITGPFQSTFGLAPLRTMHLARSSLQAWLNVGVGFATHIEFYDTTSRASDVEIEAKTCCDGDCSQAACLGRTTAFPLNFSDNCAIDLYMNTDVASRYSDDRSASFDLQSILTHEFGHCMGLGHPEATQQAQAVMRQKGYEHGAYPKRFPRVDDKTGAQNRQFVRSAEVRVRERTGGEWTVVGRTSGSVGVATRRNDEWSLVAFETDHTDPADTTSNLAHVFINGQSVGPRCINPNEWTFDGVAVSEDPSGGFSMAYLAANDSGEILVVRGIFPSLLGCTSGTRQISGLLSRRRPSLAFDPGTNRLVMSFIDMDTGQLRFSSSTTANTWRPATFLNTEWTDTSVAIDCGYWAPAQAYRCFTAFPSADGTHTLRIGEGYINASGDYVHVGTHVASGFILNAAADIQIVDGNRLEIIHGSTLNARTAYMYVRDCSGTTCSDSTAPIDSQTLLGPGISRTKLVTAGGY
ncbi:matrixin family metalloprotease [Archangium violaceum]|uniref:matrixin family metalloprotease n=1 Tax=Archangium violaceum TaxID=83451 RepID=UPI002B28D1D4|nr:matrixin family metalloprotease [Archangium violaceum]